MRMVPRTLRLVAMLGIGLGAAAAACGDDDDGATTPPADAGTDLGLLPDTGGGDFDSGGFDSGLIQETSIQETGTPSNIFDAGPTVQIPVGDAGDGGTIECFQGGIVEVEPNDTMQTATTLPNAALGTPASICGVLKGGDAGTDTSDFVSFKIAQAASSVKVNWYGNIQAPPPITVNGQPDTFQQLQKDNPYVFEIKRAANATGDIAWKFVILEE